MNTLIKVFCTLTLALSCSLSTAFAGDFDNLLKNLSNEATTSIKADFKALADESRNAELNNLLTLRSPTSLINQTYQVKLLNESEALLTSTVSLAVDSSAFSETNFTSSDDDSFSRDLALKIARDNLIIAIEKAQQALELSNHITFE